MKNIDWNALRDRAYENAKRHGFHDEEYSDGFLLMMVITEVAEAVQADREGLHANVAKFEFWEKEAPVDFVADYEQYLKGTVEDELADVIIRLLDLAGLRKVTVDPYDVDADYPLFTEFCYYQCVAVASVQFILHWKINRVISEVICYCKLNGIDIFWHIEQKMKYNELRPMMHNKAY